MKNAKTEKEFKAAMGEATTAQLLTFYNERTERSVKRFASRLDGEKRCLQAFLATRTSDDRRAEEDRRAEDRRNPAVKTDMKSLFDGLPEQPPEGLVAPVPLPQKPATKANGQPLPGGKAVLAEEARRAKEKVKNEAARVKAAAKAAKAAEKKGGQMADGRFKCPKCAATEDQTAAGKEGTSEGESRMFCHLCSTEYYHSGRVYAASPSRSAAIAKTWLDRQVADKRSERTKVEADGQQFNSVRQAFIGLNLPLEKHIGFRMELKAKGESEFQGHKFAVVETR